MTSTMASTSLWVTNLKARTASRDTFRSRFSGAWASRSQNMPRSASVVEKAEATVFAVGEPILSNFARSAADHSRQPSAVRRRKICSRVSK